MAKNLSWTLGQKPLKLKGFIPINVCTIEKGDRVSSSDNTAILQRLGDPDKSPRFAFLFNSEQERDVFIREVSAVITEYNKKCSENPRYMRFSSVSILRSPDINLALD